MSGIDDDPALGETAYRERFQRPAGDGDWYNYRTNTLWVSNTSDLVMAHEWNHFIQHISTPYGFFLQTVADLQDRFAVDYIVEAQKVWAPEPMPVPVRKVAAHLRTDPAGLPLPSDRLKRLRHLDQVFVDPWLNLATLERLFEGGGGPVTARQAAEQLMRYETRMADILGNTSLFDATVAPPSARQVRHELRRDAKLDGVRACFQIKWLDGSIHDVGGAHLMEGLARAIQGGASGALISEEELRSIAGPLYTSLFVYFFGTVLPKTVEAYLATYYSFLGLCDLALFTPIGPVYGRMRPEGADWRDLHPGWRLARALPLAMDVGLCEHLQTDLWRFQDALCQRLGWPTPREMLELGASLAPREAESWNRHRDACSWRLVTTAPEADIAGAPERYERLLLDHFPVLYHPDAGGTAVVKSTAPGEALRILGQFVLPNVLWSLMTTGIPDWQRLLPKEIQASEVFENIENNEQFIALLTSGQMAWLHPDRFVQTSF